MSALLTRLPSGYYPDTDDPAYARYRPAPNLLVDDGATKGNPLPLANRAEAERTLSHMRHRAAISPTVLGVALASLLIYAAAATGTLSLRFLLASVLSVLIVSGLVYWSMNRKVHSYEECIDAYHSRALDDVVSGLAERRAVEAANLHRSTVALAVVAGLAVVTVAVLLLFA